MTFEIIIKNLDISKLINIMKYFYPFTYLIVIFYLFLIFCLKYIMKNKKKIKLQKLYFIWNLFLTVFSICGAFKFTQLFLFIKKEKNFYYSICNNDFTTKNEEIAYWTWLFVISKVFELSDTIFIVLRKQKLLFLHWYHHITVLLLSWYTFINVGSHGKWFALINFYVHSIMYFYYTFSALNFKISNKIKIIITSIQIIQMIIGCLINYFAYYYKKNNITCQTTYKNIYFAAFIYTTYLILFINYFLRKYSIKIKYILCFSKPQELQSYVNSFRGSSVKMS